MADVAKKTSTVQQTVSSPHTPNGTSPLCELTTTQSGSFSDLSLPHEDDDTSLQDLIDSELALRIARSPSPPARGDVNTRFILEERNHSFQTYTGNDTFFFSTLEDSPPSNGEAAGAASPEEFPPSPPGSDSSPRCLPQSLAAFDPFTTTIDTESSPSADSELVCMAGELASPLEPPPGGVLLDFSEGDLPDDIGPYQTDTNPSRVVENGTLLDLSEGTPQELVGAFPEEVADDFLDPFGSSYREGSVTPDERQQGVDFLDECSLPDLVSPASSPTNLDDDAAGVVNNSMSSDDVNNPSSVVECCVVTPNVRSPGAVLIPEIDVIPPDDDDQVDEDLDMYVSSGYGVADDAEGDENEWTTVAEAVGSPEEETPPKQQPEVAVNGADTPTSVSSCSEVFLVGPWKLGNYRTSRALRFEGGEACLAHSIPLRINKWVTPSPFVGVWWGVALGGEARTSSEGRTSRQSTSVEVRGGPSHSSRGGGEGYRTRARHRDRRSILEHVVLFDEPRSVRRLTARRSDLSTEMVTEKKIKKKRSEGGEVTKTKKTKKNKKSDSEKENISVWGGGGGRETLTQTACWCRDESAHKGVTHPMLP
uniref:Uncharacterized protein n=1 Tax=Timema poppense TaxID=170557 RepID=A0A7R9GUV6_TIMPO|nr:unnamed protein product [Timema poppensis]